MFLYTCVIHIAICSCGLYFITNLYRRRRGRDRMVVGFTTTFAISAYHHKKCEFEPRSWRDVLDTTLCDKVCQLIVTGRFLLLLLNVACLGSLAQKQQIPTL